MLLWRDKWWWALAPSEAPERDLTSVCKTHLTGGLPLVLSISPEPTSFGRNAFLDAKRPELL